jgi:hypothetical protein
MGIRGPAAKPAALRAIDGRATTPSKKANLAGTVEYPIMEHAPPPPDWLTNFHAKQEWNRLAPIIARQKLLTEAGLNALGNLCALHGALVGEWTAGRTPLASLIAQYRNMVNDFGLTPLSQSRVKAPEGAASSNPFATNGRREAA